MTEGYPAHWEADVVLRDGRPAHLRPIRADDEDRLREFHAHLSAQSIYYRYFAAYPTLSDRDTYRFTHVDYVDRMAFVATMNDDIVGVGRYDRISPMEAEVAFIVRDDQQGRGLGSVLLEHLAAAARERGIATFVAEVLPENRRMLATFDEAGYRPRRTYEEGRVHLEFRIEPSQESRDVAQAREQRAEARSMEALLRPRGVAVIGASRTSGRPGHEILRHLVESGFAGTLAAVHPVVDEVLGVRAWRSVRDIPEPVDLAVIAVPVSAVDAVVDECAQAGVRALVIISGGFAESGPEGLERQRALVRRVRGHGMRLLGPHCFGVVNTDPQVRLNASLAPMLPPAGDIAVFCQSGALAVPLLRGMLACGLGLSNFVNAGNRADVSGNDLLQAWQDDPRTRVVLLYLESIGNPRKFTRIARRLTQHTPVVAIRSGRHAHAHPLGHDVGRSALPQSAVDAVFDQAGVIRVTTLDQMLDVTALLAHQPPPRGARTVVVGCGDALALVAADAVLGVDLDLIDTVVLPVTIEPADLAAAVRSQAHRDDVDVLLVVHAPGWETSVVDWSPLAQVAHEGLVTMAAVLLDRSSMSILPPAEGAGAALVAYPVVDDAVRALAAVVQDAQHRAAGREDPEFLEDVDTDRARALVLSLVHETIGDDPAGAHEATHDEIAALLAMYGLALSSGRLAQKARRTGAMPCGLRAVEDPLFGPVLAFGAQDPLADLVADRSYRIPPLSRRDALDLVRGPVSAGLVLGDPVDPAREDGLIDLVLRVGRLMDDLPHVVDLSLSPVLATPHGAVIAGARMTLRHPVGAADVRRLTIRG